MKFAANLNLKGYQLFFTHPVYQKYVDVFFTRCLLVHVDFHKIIKLIKNYKIYEIFVKIGSRRTFTRLSCSPASFQIYLWKYNFYTLK